MSMRRWLLGSIVVFVVVVAVVVILIAGAVGGDDTSSSGDSPAAPEAAGFAPSQELQDCLEEQGIEPPSGGAAPAPGQAPSLDGDQGAAIQACSEYLPSGGAPPSGAPALPGG